MGLCSHAWSSCSPPFFVNFLKMYIGNVGMNSVLYFVLLFPQRFLILSQSCQSHCLKQLWKPPLSRYQHATFWAYISICLCLQQRTWLKTAKLVELKSKETTAIKKVQRKVLIGISWNYIPSPHTPQGLESARWGWWKWIIEDLKVYIQLWRALVTMKQQMLAQPQGRSSFTC